jgi:hypothetical protein
MKTRLLATLSTLFVVIAPVIAASCDSLSSLTLADTAITSAGGRSW